MTGTEKTQNSYYERINVVVQYINNHIDEKLDLDYLSNLSCYSPFHFHRIMKSYLGESLGSYIQRSRLKAGAHLLRYTGMPIADISIKVGYETTAAFNKAFKKRFGLAPSQFRADTEYQLPFREPSKIVISMENLTLQPEYRVINDFKVIYVSAIGAYGDTSTKLAWDTICQYAGANRLFGKDTQMLGIGYDNPKLTEPERCRYEACISISKDVKPDGKIGVKTVSGGKYAVFRLLGSYNQLESSYQYIFGQWVLENSIDLRDVPTFEKYIKSPGDNPNNKLETEIWVPVR